jgi:hypothetical protein
MKRQNLYLLVAAVLFGFLSLTTAHAAKLPEAGVGLTIYNENFGVVKDRRQIDFKQGINTLKFTDVASAIDPTSVTFECLSAPGKVVILEQNYEYDLVDTASLLKRYIDKEVNVTIKGSGADVGRQLTGVLSAARDNNLILRIDKAGIEIVNVESIEAISLRQLPEDLVTKPTLVWLAQAGKTGQQLCQVTYTTNAIGWKADYSAVLNADENQIDLTGWVTIDNKSGAAYQDATVKLIAGDVRRIREPVPIRKRYVMEMDTTAAAPFEEKPFMEYHLYTLARKTTLNNNQVKQIELISPALGVPVEKLYVYERLKKSDKIQIKFEFENTEENHLGLALPKGKVRVFKRDPADGMLEFVGEDAIDHTAKKEKLSLYIGDAFDVVPEHTLLDSKRDRRMRWEKHKIELRNRKDEPVVVVVDEKFSSWVNWMIDDSTHRYQKRDARTARFEVKIGADSTATLIYSATQRW